MQFTTERLLIRTMCESDWRAMQQIAADFTASPYAIYDHAFPLEDEAIRALTAHFASTGLFFAVCLPDSPDMIGYVCFHDDNGTYDLGYNFHSACHGKGYAFESCTALLDYFTAQGIIRFTAGTALANIPSVRLLEKLGFALISTEELEFHEGHPFVGGVYRKIIY